jgi:hypothetical protein
MVLFFGPCFGCGKFLKNLPSFLICCIDNKEQDDKIAVSGEHNTKHGRSKDDQDT